MVMLAPLMILAVLSLIGGFVGYPFARLAWLAFDLTFRPPTKDELQKMEELVEQGMKDGAWGLSTGLIYNPGTYAKPDELIALAKVAARRGGLPAARERMPDGRLPAIAVAGFVMGALAGKFVPRIRLGGPWVPPDREYELFGEQAGDVARGTFGIDGIVDDAPDSVTTPNRITGTRTTSIFAKRSR